MTNHDNKKCVAIRPEYYGAAKIILRHRLNLVRRARRFHALKGKVAAGTDRGRLAVEFAKGFAALKEACTAWHKCMAEDEAPLSNQAPEDREKVMVAELTSIRKLLILSHQAEAVVVLRSLSGSFANTKQMAAAGNPMPPKRAFAPCGCCAP